MCVDRTKCTTASNTVMAWNDILLIFTVRYQVKKICLDQLKTLPFKFITETGLDWMRKNWGLERNEKITTPIAFYR